MPTRQGSGKVISAGEFIPPASIEEEVVGALYQRQIGVHQALGSRPAIHYVHNGSWGGRVHARRAPSRRIAPGGGHLSAFGIPSRAAWDSPRIVDLPIRYRERTYGTTNIQRWKHGWLLLKMTWFAFWRLKVV